MENKRPRPLLSRTPARFRCLVSPELSYMSEFSSAALIMVSSEKMICSMRLFSSPRTRLKWPSTVTLVVAFMTIKSAPRGGSKRDNAPERPNPPARRGRSLPGAT